MISSASLPPVLLEGRNWFVLDKPAGLAVHSGPKTGTSLEDLLPAYRPNRPAPLVVHRLDRDTSGCLLVAIRTSMLRRLATLFSTQQVEKDYWAIMAGIPDRIGSKMVNQSLLKVSSAARGWRMVADAKGRPAQTGFEVVARVDDLAVVRCRPKTGRTHQIRVHATLIAPGVSIVGDPVYGKAHPLGMMLHAGRLAFPDPDDGSSRVAVAPWPARFHELIPDARLPNDILSAEVSR